MTLGLEVGQPTTSDYLRGPNEVLSLVSSLHTQHYKNISKACPVVPRQRKRGINTIGAGADELADVAYVQLPKETFHLHLVTSILERI